MICLTTATKPASISSDSETKASAESNNFPDPDVLAQEIVDNREAAGEQFPESAAEPGGTETKSEKP